MRAAAIGHLKSVQELLDEGADVNERGPRDSTALMFAAGGGHLDVVRTLVERGADLEAREEGGWTALCHAEQDNDVAMIAYLQGVKKRTFRLPQV
jgi:ankyrin repeat protein